VEFALVFPIMVMMIMGILEFTFVFNAVLSMGYATRDAALVAAEAGNAAGADCVILRQVENDVSAPAIPSRITEVVIYRSDQNGAVLGGQQNVYVRNGSTTCAMADGTSLTVPYTSSGGQTYLDSGRCNILAGCGSGRTLDTIGVKVTYQHSWITPLANLVSLSGTGLTVVQSNAMRMEPVL
jgi:Flp pilus assembly protein TadG